MDIKSDLERLKEKEKKTGEVLGPWSRFLCPSLTKRQCGVLLMAAGFLWLSANLGLLSSTAAAWLWPLLLICCGLVTWGIFRQ